MELKAYFVILISPIKVGLYTPSTPKMTPGSVGFHLMPSPSPLSQTQVSRESYTPIHSSL